LIHVSNFRSVKRVSDVVSVFEAVQRRRPARLILIGDGPDRFPAERQVRERGLEARTAFLGKRDEFVDILAASDVFLLPSEQESFGLAALEAMSCGVPVVASSVGGIPEVVVDGATGYLARAGDVSAMADRVLQLVSDPAIWAAFSRRARERTIERFQLAPAIDAYEALYRRVLEKPRTTRR
jgi:L-malate glycosyltransferase